MQRVRWGEQLRFPIFVGELSPLGDAKIRELQDTLPPSARNFIARFETDLGDDILNDQRYEFRVTIVPKLSGKSDVDRAFTFVCESDLTDDERATLRSLGKSGTVVVREQVRPVAGAGLFKPSQATTEIARSCPFEFTMHHFILAWRKLDCRPAARSDHPERTDERYCVYDQPHGDYLYTPAFVAKVVKRTASTEKFQAFLGVPPKPKKTIGSSGDSPAAG